MARGLSALPFVLMVALPAGAEAASKRVTVPVPANGDVAFSQYRVSTTSPGKAVTRTTRRLGYLRHCEGVVRHKPPLPAPFASTPQVLLGRSLHDPQISLQLQRLCLPGRLDD